LEPVRLALSVSEFAPALRPARCAEVLAWPLFLLVCRPPFPELAFASAFAADFAPFPDPERLPSSSFELVLVEALLGLLSSSFELVLVEALLGLLSSSLDLVLGLLSSSLDLVLGLLSSSSLDLVPVQAL
jgi:hypothetical protein